MKNREDHELRMECYSGNKKKVAAWIKNGADVNGKSFPHGNTPLMMAINSSKESEVILEIVNLLVENGANIHEVNCKNENALFDACRANLHNVADFLVKLGIDINHENDRGEKAIDVIPGKSIVDLLLGKDNKKVVDNERSAYLKREIAKACDNYQYKKLDELLSEFGKVNYQIDNDSQVYHTIGSETPLSKVCLNHKDKPGRFKTLEVIFAHGADPNYAITYPDDVHSNLRRDEGKTPLMQVVSRTELLPVAEFLISHAADVNAKNQAEGNRSALHYAIRFDNPAALKLLINHGADLEVIVYGDNLLHYACSVKAVDSAMWLIENGFPLDDINSDGKTAKDILLDVSDLGSKDKVMKIMANIEQEQLNRSIKGELEREQKLGF